MCSLACRTRALRPRRMICLRRSWAVSAVQIQAAFQSHEQFPSPCQSSGLNSLDSLRMCKRTLCDVALRLGMDGLAWLARLAAPDATPLL